MRFILALSCALTLSAAEIPKGSHALLRMVNSVTTRTAREGDYVYLQDRHADRRGRAGAGSGGQLRSGDCVACQAQRPRERTRRTGAPDRNPDPAGRQSVEGRAAIEIGGFRWHRSESGNKRGAGAAGRQPRSRCGADCFRWAERARRSAAMADRSWKGAGIGAGAGGAVGLASVLSEPGTRSGAEAGVHDRRGIRAGGIS